MIDFYTKAVLTVIAAALVLLAIRPPIEPTPAIAQGEISVRIVGVNIQLPSVALAPSQRPSQSVLHLAASRTVHRPIDSDAWPGSYG